MPDSSEAKTRYYLLDSVRGLCILGMILYHTLFDVVFIFGYDVNGAFMQGINIIRDFGACCFIFISGLCFSLGTHNVRRSLIISVCGIVVTAATFIVMPDSVVLFGILTFMGAAGLITVPLHRLLKHIPSIAGLVVSFACFLVLFQVNYGYIGYYNHVLFALSEWLYRNILTASLGFPPNGFVSGDYYPLLPWYFMYLCGYFAAKPLFNNRFVQKKLFVRLPLLEKAGKYSLYIYLAHQPLIYGGITLLYYMTNK